MKKYPEMASLLGKAILNIQSPEDPDYFKRLFQFYSEPTLNRLYQEASAKLDAQTTVEQELGNGFAWLKKVFPAMQMPTVYAHVSGFNQNILVAEQLLSISIDKYMGEDYPLYEKFFYDFQRRKMSPAQIAPDVIAGWVMSEFVFEGKENVLLDRMIYEGKIIFLQHLIFPEIPEHVLLGYTEKELEWCKNFKKKLWKEIIQRKHLYTPDLATTNKYFEPNPSLFLSSDAPGNIGVWMGWQIIQAYMQENNISMEAMMQNNNSQEILTASKFKP